MQSHYLPHGNNMDLDRKKRGMYFAELADADMGGVFFFYYCYCICFKETVNIAIGRMESCNLCREGIYCLSQGHNNNCLSLTEANKSRNGAVERQSGKPHCSALFCWLLSVLYSSKRGEQKHFILRRLTMHASKDKEDIAWKVLSHEKELKHFDKHLQKLALVIFRGLRWFHIAKSVFIAVEASLHWLNNVTYLPTFLLITSRV